MLFFVVDLGLLPGLGLYHLSCSWALGGGASLALAARGPGPGASDRRVGPSQELVPYQEDTES